MNVLWVLIWLFLTAVNTQGTVAAARRGDSRWVVLHGLLTVVSFVFLIGAL